MPTGFNLFSLDMFEIFKPGAPKAEFTPEEMPLPSLGRDDESKNRDREQEAEIAFWGLACYPVI
ncbi:hypothetical protein [Rhizobium sp. Root564]|uniref:hypothetical protein n=1 Tax=Agrobacterium cavarae TaxID=2528239 RepID=UPI0007154372|nr:hypothetical protein ASD74_01855 [Rhizobium sp. Root564]